MYSTTRRTFYCKGDREASLPKLRVAIHGIKEYLAENHADLTLDSVEVGENDVEIGDETNELDDG